MTDVSGPTTLMIIRHGEKPADAPVEPPPFGVDDEGRQSHHSLLPRGWQRAGALTHVFGDHAAAPLVTPRMIVAPDYGKTTEIHRTTQTVTPLARHQELAIQTPLPKDDLDRLVHEVLLPATEPVLVCWEHHHIPDLVQTFAHGVGVDLDGAPSLCRFWPEDDYWSVVVFTRDDDGYRVSTTSEAALEGDPAR